MSVSSVFNESFYLTNNADVVVGISQGHFSSALQHFTLFGGKELRAPNSTFDASYYAVNNIDVLNAVAAGGFNNLFEHYQIHGEAESRAPSSAFAGFDATGYLDANPDVADAVTAGTFSSALDHYIAFGQGEARSGSNITIVPVTGSTFSMTQGTDVVTGTENNDTIDAGLTSSNQQTLNSSDRIDGGAGTDELIATITSSVTPSNLSGVEKITVLSQTNAATLDLVNATGVTDVASAGSTSVTTLQGFGSATNVTLRDTGQNQTVTYNDVTGSSDSATVNVSNVSGGTTSILGVESLTLNATGNASTIATLTATQTTGLTVTGDKGLTVTANLGTTILTADASAATGAVNLDFGAGVVTATGGSGNDDFSFEAAGTVTAVGNAGNDTFRFDATGTFTTADTVTGGDGIDTLSATAANLVTASASTPTTFRVTDVERISANTGIAASAAISLGNISTAASRFTATIANIGAATINFNAGASEFVNVDDFAGAVTLDAAGSALDDSVTLSTSAASSVNHTAGQALTTTDIETLTIDTSGTGAATAQTVGTVGMTASTGGTTTLAVTGNNSVTIAAITATNIDASGMNSATNGLTMNAAGVSVTSITGSDLVDTLVGDASSTISGGGGNDIITGGSGNDTITGGDGDDTITPNAGSADSVDGGAGNDRIIIDTDADIASGNTVTGGEGIDTFALTAVQTANAASDLRGVSGFEILELAATATESIAMSDFINNQTFTRVDFGQGGTGTLTVTNAPELVTEVRLLAGPPGDTLVFDRLVDNSSNSLTISNRADNSIAVTAVTIADEETVSISGSSATNDLLITTLTAGDMTSLTITGAADIGVSNQMTGTRMTDVDASAATGTNEVHLTANVVAATMTGGSGVDEFTGGLLADTITGNLGADIIIGGAGADIITGGGGADVITGGNGADIIDVGSGANDITMSAEGQTQASVTLAATVTLSGADVITSVAATDQIVLSTGYTAATAAAGANTLVTAADTTLSNGLLAQTYGLQRGDYVQSGTTSGTGTFIFGSGGADMLFAYDADSATGTTTIEAIVLQGATTLTASAATSGGTAVVTFA
jgi:hypothetical protein